PALVAAPRGVANHHRQDVDAEVIVVAPPDGAANQETPVAAAEVEDQRRLAAEQLFQVEQSVRQLLQGGLRPRGRVEDLAGHRHAELALDLPTFFLLRFHNTPSSMYLRYEPEASATDCGIRR